MDLRKLAVVLAAATWMAAAPGCGGGDENCDGFVTINARPEDCQARAERLGCTGVEIDGPSCGLFGCVRCTDESDETDSGS